MKLKCDCSREWEYKGKNKYYATCPDCRSMVKVTVGVEGKNG